ncbi:MAG: response regulator [Deltaproteobacteria bacterium]|jgi:signal transduction histidine kinase/AmiR/NasT family two-component response regulator|nr:response regulator [Deltaproteobacteria bacterium]
MKFFVKEHLTTPLFFVSAVIMLLISLYIRTLMNSTSDFLENNIESRLLALSRLAAVQVTSAELDQLRTPQDMEKPEYAALKERLIKFGEEVDILFVYYMRLTDDGQLCQFIIDNDLSEDTVGLSTEPIPVEESPESAFNGIAATAGLGNYSEGYSGLLSSFAPVFDPEGNVVAIAGVDITDEAVLLMQERITTTVILLVVSMLLVIASGCLGLYLYNRKARQSESANISKSQFLANMSHEIRTPLNAVIGLSDIELQKDLPEDSRESLEKIHKSGVSLLSIINDILDISKIEAGAFKIVLVDFEVSSFIDDVVQQNIMRIGSKIIKFSLNISEDFPMELHGDEIRIRQIVSNLLSNAFKYTKEGTVELKIWSIIDNEIANCYFSVTDSGIGIKPKDLSRLFNEYAQLDSKANRNIEGTGLGLSITKKLISLMDGNITVESEYGKGSIFTVEIPLKMVGTATLGKEVAGELESLHYGSKKSKLSKKTNFSRSKLPPGRVLVVDDLDVNLLVAKGLLKHYGLQIDTAISGMEAIEKIKAVENGPEDQKYDIIFMDHMMPNMDGIEATNIIRNNLHSDYAKNVPIVALTANAIAGSKEMFLKNGFNSFISKPIDLVQLDEELIRWVKEKSQQMVSAKH